MFLFSTLLITFAANVNNISIKFPPFKKSLLTVSVLLLCCVSAANIADGKETFFLPDDEYLRSVWTTEDGLPQNSVNDILQSRDGYLWLATFGGLARFDGVKFTTFNSGNTPGLMSNRILSICEDRTGTIWIGAQTGEVMTLKNGIGKTYTIADGLSGADVTKIFETADGNIWVNSGAKLMRFDGDKFITYDERDGLPAKFVWNIEKGADDSVWLYTEKGLIQFKNGNFHLYDNPPEGFETEWTRLLVAGRENGNFWINTANGLVSFDGGEYTAHPVAATREDKLVYTVFEDENETLWIVYYPSGNVYKLRNGVATLFPIKENQAPVKSIFKDREGNFWFGTTGGGLVQLKKRKLISYSSENGLPNGIAKAVVGDGDGGVWIATLGLANWKNGKFTIYTKEDGLPSNETSALFLDRERNLWIGSNAGLIKFKNGKFTVYDYYPVMGRTKVTSLFEDRDGTLWIGTFNGLAVMRGEEITVFPQSDGLVNDNISYITQTRDGAMWFATVGGISRMENGKFTNYTTAQGLSINYVRDIYEDADGTLWLGTYGGGLNRLKNGKIDVITVRNGLYDDFISRILPDERGNLWMLTNRGIFHVGIVQLNNYADKRANSLPIISYNAADGMISSEGNGGNQPAGWRTSDGKMWFPTIKGVAVIDADIPAETFAPPVIIEKIIVDRNEIPLAQTLEINPGQENLEIEYTGINFSRPEQIKFKYRLLGLDTGWVDVGTRRTVYFPHLPPGDFVFQVVAENGDTIESPNIAALRIIVHPPFWRTSWFLLGCLLAAGLIIFAVFRYRIAQLERARLAQQDFSRRLINAHETERRRIAGELHDSIGQSLAMIKNRAVFSQMKINDEQTKEHLEIIAAQTSQTINEVREISYNLRPYLLERLGLTQSVKSLINEVADLEQVRITADIDDIDDLFDAEREMDLFRIIQEIVNNIVKHSEADAARVSIKKEAAQLTISAEDNGKGFDTGNTAKKRYDQGGFGLIGMAERVRILDGRQKISSAPGAGTKISIVIKLAQAK